MVGWPVLRRSLGGLSLASLAACAPGAHESSSSAVPAGATAPVWRAQADATVHGPRLVPETLDPRTSFGIEPGGGARFIAGGLRILRLPGGSVLTSEQRFPASSAPRAYSLPARLGGGSLFVVENTLLRSDSWLSSARPIYTFPSEIVDVWPGLDRLYVRARSGAQVAVDPRKAVTVDLGPWPSAPSVTSYRALDGWRAAAIADLRGAVASFDAGATWRRLDLPVDPQRVSAARVDPLSGETYEVAASGGDFLFVRGPEASHQCFSIAADSPPIRMASCPVPEPSPDAAPFTADLTASKIFGPRPLLVAVEDGWPLEGGTALVARDGALGRVRLSDGAWVALRQDAFSSKPSRCHPLPLLVDEGSPGLGFVCAEPRGKTVLYATDPARMTMREVRAFDDSREVLSFANGAIAARGPCEGLGEPPERRYCVFSRSPGPASRAESSPRWSEVVAPGDPLEERLLVHGDGRVAVLSPPAGKLDDAHLTVLGPASRTVKLTFPVVPPEVRRALESGIWLDGFEERAPGLFGGWVEGSGAMLGVEVSDDGQVHVGAYVRDAGSPMVSGRYGLGWAASRRGYETTDGGMTWTAMEVPAPLSVPRERACGPVGCSAAGWIRVGWGPAEAHAPEVPLSPPPAYRPPSRDLDLDLVCEPLEGAFSTAPAPESGFYGAPFPSGMRAEDQVVRADATSSLDRQDRLGALARLFAWGPRSDDWAHVGRWAVQWIWPYGGSRDVRASSPSLAPFATPEAARRALVGGSPANVTWSLATGDEPSAALLVGRRFGVAPGVTGVFALEAERSPLEVHRADGEPFADVDFAVRAGGHWYLVTPQATGEPRASVVYRVDGSEARELARVPRSSSEHRTLPVARLARRTDGRSIGLVVVEGQPSPDALRWVLPLDIETGAPGEPEPLGSADLRDRPRLSPCTEDDVGWVLDTAWNGSAWSAKARVELGSRASFDLRYLYLRVRLTSQKACVEQVSGTYEAEPRETLSVPGMVPGSSPSPARPKSSLPVSVLQSHSRSALRCHPR